MSTGRALSIIFGGMSSEYDASVASFRNVLEIARLEGWISSIDGAVHIDLKGGFHWVPPEDFGVEDFAELPRLTSGAFDTIAASRWFWNLAIGQQGENGELAGFASVRGLQGSFNSVATDALSFDKAASSHVVAGFLRDSVLLPETRWIADGRSARIALDSLDSEHVIVKPVAMGASIFVEQFDRGQAEEIERHVSRILDFDTAALIQERIQGREVSCGVYGSKGSAIALPAAHIDCHSGIFGHAEKLSHSSVTVAFEGLVSSAARIEQAALDVYRVLGFQTWARLDFIVRHEDIYFLEANSVPGMMKNSLFPAMLRAGRVSLGEFVDVLRGSRSGVRPRREYRYVV